MQLVATLAASLQVVTVISTGWYLFLLLTSVCDRYTSITQIFPTKTFWFEEILPLQNYNLKEGCKTDCKPIVSSTGQFLLLKKSAQFLSSDIANALLSSALFTALAMLHRLSKQLGLLWCNYAVNFFIRHCWYHLVR